MCIYIINGSFKYASSCDVFVQHKHLVVSWLAPLVPLALLALYLKHDQLGGNSGSQTRKCWLGLLYFICSLLNIIQRANTTDLGLSMFEHIQHRRQMSVCLKLAQLKRHPVTENTGCGCVCNFLSKRCSYRCSSSKKSDPNEWDHSRTTKEWG